MPIHIAIPIVGGALAVGAIGLRLRSMALAKKSKSSIAQAPAVPVPPPTPVAKPAATPVIKPNQTVLDVGKSLGLPGSGFPQTPGTRTGTVAEMVESMADPIGFQKRHPDISWDAITDEQLNAALEAFNAQKAAKAPLSVSSSAVVGQQAVVTTNDPAPNGDLIIRDRPGGTQIGGAEKNGRVAIIQQVDDTWAEVQWPGGSRRPAARGFARKAFLKLV